MNEPTPDSVFGTITNQCSILFCKDKDGLELWLNLVNECYDNSIFYKRRILLDLLENDDHLIIYYNALYVGIICSLVSFICFTMTYVITKRFYNNKNKYN